MKMVSRLTLGMFLSAAVLTQQAPTLLADSAPADQTGSAPQAKKGAPAKRAAVVEPAVTLTPGPAVVIANNLNVRGQATVNSEVIKRLNEGDTVTVLEQINLEKFKPDEPRQWAKIAYPEGADVWVSAQYIDRANMVSTPAKLNLRSGPGENYSVVGVIERGTPVREVLTDNNWMRISAPAGAYAFVAAMYLKQETPAAAQPTVATTPTPMPAVEPTEPTPVTVPEPEVPVIAATPTMPEPAPAPAPASNLMTMQSPLLPAEPPAIVPEPAQPPPPRVVSHEGVVRRTVSIQAPTPYALVDPDTGRTINYLYTTSTNLDLGSYKGLRIVVTGEESIDRRWTNSPVVTIRRIHVLD